MIVAVRELCFYDAHNGVPFKVSIPDPSPLPSCSPDYVQSVRTFHTFAATGVVLWRAQHGVKATQRETNREGKGRLSSTKKKRYFPVFGSY